MDMAFLIRAERMLGPHRPAGMDYDILLATLVAQQAASPTARAAARRRVAEPGAPIVELLLAGPAWEEAARAQQGCFNRASAKPRFNQP